MSYVITTEGLLTVAEVARRLNLSSEQVRRKLREGKLRGQHLGNQWFVEERELTQPKKRERKPLIPIELQERARKNREAIFRRTGIVFDVVSDLRANRESH